MKKASLGSKKSKILALCLVLGIIFLFLSEYSVLEKKNTDDEFDEAAYTLELEERLCAILEEMDGVSDVKVMITLAGGRTFRYAKQSTQSLSDSSSSSETFLQLQEESGGVSSPILTQILLPDIKGVCVVCRGAENIAVQRRIIGVVASTLDLNKNQIYVSE